MRSAAAVTLALAILVAGAAIARERGDARADPLIGTLNGLVYAIAPAAGTLLVIEVADPDPWSRSFVRTDAADLFVRVDRGPLGAVPDPGFLWGGRGAPAGGDRLTFCAGDGPTGPVELRVGSVLGDRGGEAAIHARFPALPTCEA